MTSLRRAMCSRFGWPTLLAILVVVTAGCQTVVGTTETVRSIQQETGALDVQVRTPDPTGDEVVVRYSSQHGQARDVRAEAERVAEVLWRERRSRADASPGQP
jgi:hypothetical protein